MKAQVIMTEMLTGMYSFLSYTAMKSPSSGNPNALNADQSGIFKGFPSRTRHLFLDAIKLCLGCT